MAFFNLIYGKNFLNRPRLQPEEKEFGIEIEVEGARLPVNDLPKPWAAVHDGSLRNGGVEYVVREPVPFNELHKSLTELEQFLIASKFQPDYSHRTSVHVHRNAQHMTLTQIYTVITSYLLLENLLVRYSGPLREGNLFCLRASDAEQMVLDLKASIRAQHGFAAFNDNMRYGALNLAAMNKFGTLEFRSFRGTTNAEEIFDWCDILQTLVISTINYYDNPHALVNDYITNGARDFAAKVVPGRFLDWMMKNDDWYNQIDCNSHYAIELATAIDWPNVLAAERKEPKVAVGKKRVKVDEKEMEDNPLNHFINPPRPNQWIPEAARNVIFPPLVADVELLPEDEEENDDDNFEPDEEFFNELLGMEPEEDR